MFPYVTPQPVYLAGMWIHWSVLLTVLGVLVAHLLLLRRARLTGLDAHTAAAMSFCMVAAGAAGARLFKLVYLPGVLPDVNWGVVLLAGGMASFGGLAGGLFGASLYFAARRPQPGGLFLSSFFVLYGVFRLWLDTLHVDPPRYAGVTVDQWAYGSMFLAGIILTFALRPFRKEVFA